MRRGVKMQLRDGLANPILGVFLLFGLILTIPSSQAYAQIAFMSERDGNKEIYVMGTDGQSPRNITRHPADDWTPALSPNGKRLAFMSDRHDGNYDIYVMDINDGNPQRLTRHPWSDGSPSWSPGTFSRSGNRAVPAGHVRPACGVGTVHHGSHGYLRKSGLRFCR